MGTKLIGALVACSALWLLLAPVKLGAGRLPSHSPCGPAPTTVTPQHTGGVIVYGDSIATGGWPQALGWQADAQGCRTLHDDTGAVARLRAQRPEAVWLAIGTNDYYLSKWAPAEFGAAYGSMLDRLKGRKVYAQTPLLRAKEPPNALGDTLDDYRSAIMAECSKRDWVTCIDGTALVPVEMMPDGVHPSPEAQAVYAAAVGSAINRTQ